MVEQGGDSPDLKVLTVDKLGLAVVVVVEETPFYGNFKDAVQIRVCKPEIP